MFFNQPNWRAMGIFAVVISSIGLIAALVMAAYSWRFVSVAHHADGRVVKFDEREGMYYPVYMFADSGGTSHTIYSNMGSSSPDYAVGQTINVLYKPNDPDSATINDFEHLWLFPVAFGGVSFPWLVIGLFVIWRFHKSQEHKAGINSFPPSTTTS